MDACTKDIYCAMTSGEKAETVRACNTAPCVMGQWKSAAEWSECSRVCGGGSKEHKVACVAGDSSVLPDKACESSGVRPQSQAPCNMHKCLTTSWFVGSWNKCSAKCDGGVQQREVACIASGVVKPDINCAYAGAKAAKERACSTTPCSPYVRKYSDWSECTSSCGGGSQERTQMCFNTVANRAARSPDKCSAPVEELKRRCNTQKCVVYQWNLDQWGSCSKKCDGGVRKRDVTCLGDGSTVADSACLLVTAKPDTQRSCHSAPCNTDDLFARKVSEFGVCNKQCGGGEQVSEVACVSTTGAVAEEVSMQHRWAALEGRAKLNCSFPRGVQPPLFAPRPVPLGPVCARRRDGGTVSSRSASALYFSRYHTLVPFHTFHTPLSHLFPKQ